MNGWPAWKWGPGQLPPVHGIALPAALLSTTFWLPAAIAQPAEALSTVRPSYC